MTSATLDEQYTGPGAALGVPVLRCTVKGLANSRYRQQFLTDEDGFKKDVLQIRWQRGKTIDDIGSILHEVDHTADVYWHPFTRQKFTCTCARAISISSAIDR